jgi:hypothetical protein
LAPSVAQTLPVVIPQGADPWFGGLAIPATAPTQGMWSPVIPWPIVGLHSVVLPSGDILTFGTPPGQSVQDGRTLDRWNPLAPGNHLTLPNSQNVNSFCGAGILQNSGSLLVSGGNAPRQSTQFDYTNNTATTSASQLASDRWYASVIKLADGRSLITGGATPYAIQVWQNPDSGLGSVAMTPEVFDPTTGWSSLFGANSRTAFGPDYNRWWYPRNWVAPNGQVFGITSEQMWYLDPAGNGSIRSVGTFKTPVDNVLRPNIGPTCTAAMYDVGRILQVGGNGYFNQHATNSSAKATTFDIRNGDPVVTETNPMAFGRQWANSTVLPNGFVLVTGGTQFADNGDPDAVRAAEWWNPGTGAWTTLASAQNIRNYHSVAVLLPNGLVLVTGGGVPGPADQFNGQIYYPPYLFQTSGGAAALAARPLMISASALQTNYAGTFQIEMADANPITRVVMMGLGAATHSFDMGQRLIPLNFFQVGAMLTLTSPASANIAPPGYYQVVALNAAGVPSRGFIIAVAATPAPAPALVAADPVAVYPFDQASGTTTVDNSGNRQDGTLMGGATYVAGKVGNAVNLSGASQYVDLPDGLVASCSDFTFAAWVKLAANPNWNRVFDFSGSAGTMFLTPAANGPTLQFGFKTSSGTDQRISYPYSFPAGAWKHVAVTMAGGTGRLYLDGAQVAQNASMSLRPSDLGITPNVFLGRSPNSWDPYMNGSLDEVRISCRAYSADEVRAAAGGNLATYPFDQSSGTVATDVSGSGHNGTLSGGAAWTAGQTGNAVKLAGTGQYVNLPADLPSNCHDFSFATWVNLAANPNWSRIFDAGSSTLNYMFLTPVAGDKILRFAIRLNGGVEQQVSYGVNLSLGQWRHVAVTRAGGTGRLYLDGVEVAQNPGMTIVPAQLAPMPNVWLGRSQYPDPTLNGALDDTRFACRAFPASEISALAVPPGNLIAAYPFDETAGANVIDASTNGKNATLVGGATRVDGKKGNAVALSGNAQYATMPAGLGSSCTDFTFAGWVNVAAAGNWSRLFDFGNGTGTYMFLSTGANGANLRFGIRNQFGGEQGLSSNYALPLNTWKHVAVTLAGSTARIYVDGAQIAQGTSITLHPTNLGALPNVWIGRSQWPADTYLNGKVDDYRFSCRAFSAAEISALAK